MKSRIMHNKHCEELSGPASLRDNNAITNENSSLNNSKFFHVIDGMAPDVIHDIATRRSTPSFFNNNFERFNFEEVPFHYPSF